MKTVSGAVVSSKPVSLSKAAKILSKFALADNGASPAYAAYLKRTSDSFDELVHFHKELRGSGSERKSKKHRSGNHVVEKEDSIGTSMKDDKERKDQAALVNGHDSKKKKDMKEIQGKSDLVSVDESRVSRKMKKELKKIKKEDQENGGEMKVEGENGGKRSKKRKSEEMVDEGAIGSSEKQVHKKKKGKSDS